MAISDYYSHTTYPTTGASLASSSMRTELEAIESGISAKLPDLTSNGSKAVIINAGATALTVTNGTFALAGNFATVGAYASTFTMTGATTVTFPTSGTLLSTAAVITPNQGGTGIANNNSSTLTISGAYASTFTLSGTTSVTFPTSGTLSTTSNKLSAFAATTSAELAGVISDETGTGALVFATNPTFSLSDVTTNNVSASAHGWCPKLSGTSTTFLNGSGTFTTPASTVSIVRSARTSNTILAAGDLSTLVDITSGTFSQTFTAAATLGSGWYCYLKNSGTGNITLDPNGSETIDGLTTYIMYPGESRLVQCDGSGFNSIVLSPFSCAFTSSGTFTKPPGYNYFSGLAWSGGASGRRTNSAVTRSDGGGGGGCTDFTLPASVVGATETVTIGAGGAAVTTVAAGNLGGNTSFGSLVSVYAGLVFGQGGSVVSGLITPSIVGILAVGYEGADSANQPTLNAIWGGGASDNVGTVTSGKSVYGAGAGGSLTNIAGVLAAGTSIFGGAGGAAVSATSGTDGSAPGGGGGATQTGTSSGAGARGELRIWGIA